MNLRFIGIFAKPYQTRMNGTIMKPVPERLLRIQLSLEIIIIFLVLVDWIAADYLQMILN